MVDAKIKGYMHCDIRQDIFILFFIFILSSCALNMQMTAIIQTSYEGTMLFYK